MMLNKKNKVDSDALLLAWCLIKQCKLRTERISEFGKDFFSPTLYQRMYYPKIYDYPLQEHLKHFLYGDMIPELYILKQMHNDKNDTLDVNEISHFISEQVRKDLEKDVFFSLISHQEATNKIFIWDYEMKLNFIKLQEYIDIYLEKWKNDQLYLPYKNFFKAEKQLGIVVEYVYLLLKDYPSTNLILDKKNCWDGELEFVANILFLESINDIEIINLVPGNKGHGFRLNIKNKFYKDFKQVGEALSCEFNFPSLSKSNDKNKVSKIHFKAPKSLTYMKNESLLNMNKVPYQLINLAQKNNGIVDEEVLRKTTEEKPAAILKALNNFRRYLRTKFGFPKTEQFFTSKGGFIEFDLELFDFT